MRCGTGATSVTGARGWMATGMGMLYSRGFEFHLFCQHHVCGAKICVRSCVSLVDFYACVKNACDTTVEPPIGARMRTDQHVHRWT